MTRYENVLEDFPLRQTYTSTKRHSRISAEVLANRFGICIERARETLRATVQKVMSSDILPISRRYRADRKHTLKQMNGKFATDKVWEKSRSLNGNTASQIYIHKCGFNASYLITRANNKYIGYRLNDFVIDYGATEHLTYDGAAV